MVSIYAFSGLNEVLMDFIFPLVLMWLYNTMNLSNIFPKEILLNLY